MTTNKDFERLRGLAAKVREIAELPVQKENRKLWTAVNDLHMIRPVLHARDLQISLLAYEDELTATLCDPFLRSLEQKLLLTLYEWDHLRLDRVVEPQIDCPCVITDTGFGIAAKADGGENYSGVFDQNEFLASGAYDHAVHYKPQLSGEDDLDLIKTPQVIYHEEETIRRLALMKEIFGGILEVKLHGVSQFPHTPWDELLMWIGINEGMVNFAVEPEFMHAAIKRYMQACISRVKQYEALGILSSNNRFENIGNNGIGYTGQLPQPTESGIGAKLKDIWGANADQILTSVSPQMSEEFAFAYESEYAQLFGLYGYGCCERLDNKLDGLKRYFPNLRKVSSSPYNNLERTLEELGGSYTVCFKPNSNYFTQSSCYLEYFRKELADACALAQKYRANLVVNMKTIITLGNDPTKLWKWCDMAKDLVANY